jgi:hypothetical protein
VHIAAIEQRHRARHPKSAQLWGPCQTRRFGSTERTIRSKPTLLGLASSRTASFSELSCRWAQQRTVESSILPVSASGPPVSPHILCRGSPFESPSQAHPRPHRRASTTRSRPIHSAVPSTPSLPSAADSPHLAPRKVPARRDSVGFKK